MGAIINKKIIVQQAGIKCYVYDKVARKMYNIKSVSINLSVAPGCESIVKRYSLIKEVSKTSLLICQASHDFEF